MIRRVFLAQALLLAFAGAAGLAAAEERFEIILEAADGMADGQSLRRSLAAQLEGRFDEFNRIFRFDPERLEGPLAVRAFGERLAYESHVEALSGRPAASGATYLHFEDPALRELAVDLSGDWDREGIAEGGAEGGIGELSFQAFAQFLRAFVPNPPEWIFAGFGARFAALSIDGNGVASLEESQAWLESVKAMPLLPEPFEIMAEGARDRLENFVGLAWSLASFFLNHTDGSYLRSLGESLAALESAAGAEENAAIALARIAMWHDPGTIARSHRAYLDSRETFAELIELGRAERSAGRTAEARAAFRRAAEMRPEHYAGPYYLGLVAYDEGDAEAAHDHYLAAHALGADPELVAFALALNAAAAGWLDDAVELLRAAASLAPDRFGARAEDVMERIQALR